MSHARPDLHDVAGWTLGAVLRRQAARHGDKELVRMVGGGALGYAAADRLADRVARGLARLGLDKGDHLGVVLPNGLEFCAVWLGAGRAGVVHVPVNVEYRGVFLSHVLRNCGARVVVCHADYLANLAAVAGELEALQTVVVAGGEPEATLGGIEVIAYEALLDEDDCAFEADVSYHDTATIMYTSGTTGPSKGVLMPHAHDYLFGLGIVENLPLDEHDVYYIALPLFHANGLLMQLYGALIAGATAVVRDRFSASGWIEDIRHHRATATNTLGVMNEFVLAQPAREHDRDHVLAKVAVAPTTPTLPDDFRERFGIESTIGIFGMTEVNIPVYTETGVHKPGSCGRTYERFFEVAIVDPDTDEPLSPGETGEIVVRPKQPFGFMSGYHAMPEETVSAWRNFWFHTGDAAYADADGYYYFVDRIKDCIRRRGENISSFMIESVLQDHPAVSEAAAIAVKSEIRGGEDEIKAVVVLESGADLKPEALAEHCARHMPAFAVPRYVEFVDALPKTPTEKVRKAALREAGVNTGTWDRLAGS